MASTHPDTPAQDTRTDEMPVARPQKPCCCPPRVAAWGSTKGIMVAVGAKQLEDDELLVRADANASVNPPGGPAVNADGSGGSELRTRLRKDVDLLAVTVTYTFRWRVTAQCQPISVAVTIHGDVHAIIPCAPDEGSTSLSVRRVQTAEEVNLAPRASATATVVALDCHGTQVRCDVTLHEP